MKAAVPLLLGLLLGADALAQEKPALPTENVTVSVIKDGEAAIAKFVEGMTVPTRVAGKMARWKDGVCPIVVGLPPDAARRMAGKIRALAAEVGAPVNPKDTCPGNVEVIFTGQPQALLDYVRIMYPVLLGYYDNSAQADKLATATRPIQSWYITKTIDLRGNAQVDGVKKGGGGVRITMPVAGYGSGGPPMPAQVLEMNMPDATLTNVTGSRLGDGLSSALSNVMIVADISKLVGRDAENVYDYIAVLALAQITPPDACQPLPSILNLFATGCSGAVLTSADTAYLRALYKVTATNTFATQRQEMDDRMKEALTAKP